mmetsp:Transcript_15359/g.11164  ORF Transcript_15359/g.11164 Transcript_15359/m.11164 type:complete len:232 (+) Transcript_15359:298-993(+)
MGFFPTAGFFLSPPSFFAPVEALVAGAAVAVRRDTAWKPSPAESDAEVAGAECDSPDSFFSLRGGRSAFSPAARGGRFSVLGVFLSGPAATAVTGAEETTFPAAPASPEVEAAIDAHFLATSEFACALESAEGVASPSDLRLERLFRSFLDLSIGALPSAAFSSLFRDVRLFRLSPSLTSPVTTAGASSDFDTGALAGGTGGVATAGWASLVAFPLSKRSRKVFWEDAVVS